MIRSAGPFWSHTDRLQKGTDDPRIACVFTLSSGHTVKLDPADAEKAAAGVWWAHPQKNDHVYVRGKVPGADGKQRTLFLHRYLVDAQPHERVYHRNGDALDNRRSNLHIVPPRHRVSDLEDIERTELAGNDPTADLDQATTGERGTS